MRRVLFGIILNSVFICLTLAQFSIDSYSIGIGRIRTDYSESSLYSDYQYAFYPELQLGGNMFAPPFTWTVYWGYWTDGITQAFHVSDMVTYSNHTHIIGVRIGALSSGPLRIGVFGGIAHHFIFMRYIGGSGIAGDRGYDHSQSMNTLEVGLNASFPLFEVSFNNSFLLAIVTMIEI